MAICAQLDTADFCKIQIGDAHSRTCQSATVALPGIVSGWKRVAELEGQDDFLMIVRRIDALAKFLDSDDGKNLLAGVKRASNILRIEEKKDGKSYAGAPDDKLLAEPEEVALAAAVAAVKAEASAAVGEEDFARAMSAMAKLRPFVDAFFDKVTVNVTDLANAKALRANRLTLLNEIREATRAVADFSKIEG